MDCQVFKDWLMSDLDQRHAGPLPEPVHAHVEVCAECRSWLNAARQLRTGLAKPSLPAPPASLMPRILSGWEEEVRAERRLRRNRFLRTALALAASLLVMVAGYLVWRQPDAKPTSTGGPVVESPQPKPPPVPPTPPSNLPPENVDEQRLLREAGSALVSLMARTADEAVDQGKLLIPISTPMFDPGEPASEANPTQPLTRAGQTVSTSLEPVTTSARRAMNLFLRDYARMDF